MILTYAQIITQSTPIFNSAIKVYKTSDSVIGNTNGIVLCNFLEAENSKGIAISHDGLMCSGINANQDFNICTKGTGQIFLRSNTSISGSLNVAGNAILSGSLNVSGNTVLSGSLNISGDATLHNVITTGYISVRESGYGYVELLTGASNNYCGTVTFIMHQANKGDILVYRVYTAIIYK